MPGQDRKERLEQKMRGALKPTPKSKADLRHDADDRAKDAVANPRRIVDGVAVPDHEISRPR